ncbi:MAG: polysaccharide deacetylase family protein [Lachnospiraceae bacterium]
MSDHSRKQKKLTQTKKIAKSITIVLCMVLVAVILFGVLYLTSEKRESSTNETENAISDTSTGQIVSGAEGESETSSQTETQTQTQSETQTEAQTETQTETETQSETSAETNQGSTIVNTIIDNVSSLSNEIYNWGSGGNVDELNRPVGCLMYVDKFSQYPADFIQMTEEKVIYLTFDEGYEYGFTPKILDTLEAKDCPAVFFITKPFAESEPDLVQRMIDGGFLIGNHSVTHPADGLPSETIEQQTEEIMGVHNYMLENYDYTMCLFRYPAGKFSEQSLALLNNLNYRGIFWSYAYMDYDVNNQPSESESLQKMIDGLHPGAIYLLHGVSQTNANVLGDFIDAARAKGYRFAPYTDVIE